MIPLFIQPFLWSYDVEKLDLLQDKKRIITNILNLGTVQATKWLFETYSKEDIKEALINPLSGELSKKSINFWGLVLDVKPDLTNQRIIK